MVAGMSYFRVKWRRLPAAYRVFLRDHLAPGGTIVISNCEIRWSTTGLGERYVFQHGAVGARPWRSSATAASGSATTSR